MLLKSIIKTAAWLLDPQKPKKISEEDRQKVIREEKASKIREEELDEIAEEVKKVKKQIAKVDYKAIILEALRSEAVMELLANIQDERLHDHIGVTNLIAERIKAEIAPLEGKVTQIQEGVLEVKNIQKQVEILPDPFSISTEDKVQVDFAEFIGEKKEQKITVPDSVFSLEDFRSSNKLTERRARTLIVGLLNNGKIISTNEHNQYEVIK